MGSTDSNKPGFESAGEAVGGWTLRQSLSETLSGHWWAAAQRKTHQPGSILVYNRVDDAGAVLVQAAQAEQQGWRHPDILWPVDSGLTPDGRPYVVVAGQDGEPLLHAVKSASLRRRLEWVVQLCELLLIAETAGHALGELDPSLLWVGPQNQLRLVALALTRRPSGKPLSDRPAQRSRAAKAFLCPEHTGPAPGGASAQVFAVGVLMALLVTGRLPYPVAVDSSRALPQWPALKPLARAELDDLLQRAGSPEPELRPRDVADLALEIEFWLDGSEGGATTEAGALAALQQHVHEEARSLNWSAEELKKSLAGDPEEAPAEVLAPRTSPPSAPTPPLTLEPLAAPAAALAPPPIPPRRAPPAPALAEEELDLGWLWLAGAAVVLALAALGLWWR
ncbi:hypothetical protein [Inhella gelatinilytica]|uniref:Protein kinase domain-containing protein n=1 Tax=Inhella gelatinilytica TaxID=2795030 RepID=A0A931IYU5_9BURK|nr:hypothetical protein [Inhella gelatinilytica]MBH9553604.1 hypothetical protein [Inhella gelatinilytica]